MFGSYINNSNPLNSGRRIKPSDKNLTNVQGKRKDPSPFITNQKATKNPFKKMNTRVATSIKNNKRAGLQSAKVTSNINYNPLSFMSIYSPKVKNDLASHSILPPISQNPNNSNNNITKQGLVGNKNPVTESISTTATAQYSHHFVDPFGNMSINKVISAQNETVPEYVPIREENSQASKRCERRKKDHSEKASSKHRASFNNRIDEKEDLR